MRRVMKVRQEGRIRMTMKVNMGLDGNEKCEVESVWRGYLRVPLPSRILSCDEKGECFQAGMTSGGRIDQKDEIIVV